MLTTKNTGGEMGQGTTKLISARHANHRLWGVVPCVLLACWLVTGCRPPGPQALLDGQKLVDRGQYADAVVRLKTATEILSTNAQAWNYLGLAYHQTGQLDEAAEAYKKALTLDQNLVEAHYNLGCLYLDQNHPELAKSELTTFTLHRDKSLDGWNKLGTAQLALHDLSGAERSLNNARLIDALNPEALNNLGVVKMQRNNVTEAAQYFNAALRSKPDYAPALLNIAIISQTQLSSRAVALQRYHEYLALNPKPANWDAVDSAARALEQEMNGTTVAATPRPAPATNAITPATIRPAPTTASARPAKPEPGAAANPKPTASVNTATVAVTQVPPEPVIRGANNPAKPVDATTGADKPEHRGFLSRVFGGSKPGPTPAVETNTTSAVTTAPIAPMPEPKPVVYPRYTYHTIKKPAAGDRAAATQAFAEGARAQQARQLPEAAAAYRRAIQADPTYFEAYYNLGVVSMESGSVPQGLAAYETALAIQPESHDSRFNFALALKANYPVDAANELEKLLAKSPNDADAHFALANLYAEPLRQAAKAREHYQKVLELKPAFPQAAAIKSWLWANGR